MRLVVGSNPSKETVELCSDLLIREIRHCLKDHSTYCIRHSNTLRLYCCVCSTRSTTPLATLTTTTFVGKVLIDLTKSTDEYQFRKYLVDRAGKK